MSQQHRTAPSRATFALDFNDNNDEDDSGRVDVNSSTDKQSSQQLVGTGIRPSADHFTPTRRYTAPYQGRRSHTIIGGGHKSKLEVWGTEVHSTLVWQLPVIEHKIDRHGGRFWKRHGHWISDIQSSSSLPVFRQRLKHFYSGNHFLILYCDATTPL